MSEAPIPALDNAPLDHQELATRVRFSLDEPMRLTEAALADRAESFDSTRAMLVASSVRATARLLPGVHAAVRRACENLLLSAEPETFVSSDPTPNAGALTDGSRCFIRLNSGLIQLLEPAELAAVIGHEIGHATLRHMMDVPDSDAQATFALERRRAQEISADRIGLIAAGDATHALRAEIKVACGLGAPHLSPELDGFIEQLTCPPSDHDAPWEAASTHPTLALTFWAQRHFATSDLYLSLLGLQGGAPFDTVEREIEDRFLRAGAGAAFRMAADHVHEAIAWVGILTIAHDGNLTPSEHSILVEFVGRIWADDAFAYARRHGMPAVERRAAETLAPLRFSGRRARDRVEQAVRELAARAEAEHRIEEMMHLISRALEP